MAIFCIDASEKEDFANWKKEHDSNLLDKVAEKIKAEMIEEYPPNVYGVKAPTPFTHFSYNGVCKILNKVITELKEGVRE